MSWCVINEMIVLMVLMRGIAMGFLKRGDFLYLNFTPASLIQFIFSDGFGEVVERSLGLWHTKCFPKSSAPNQEDVEMLCRELGFNNVENLQAIVKGDIIDAKRNGKFSNIKFIPVEFHSSNATKVVLYSKFSPTIINEAFTIHMKTNKPLGKIVAWEKDDHENCLRMEIKCN